MYGVQFTLVILPPQECTIVRPPCYEEKPRCIEKLEKCSPKKPKILHPKIFLFAKIFFVGIYGQPNGGQGRYLPVKVNWPVDGGQRTVGGSQY